MSDIKHELANIRSADLRIFDNGILSLFVNLDYEESGSSQGYGGYCYGGIRDGKPDGSPLLFEHIYALLDAFGVSELSELAGKKCWVYFVGDTFQRKIKYIKSLRSDGGVTVNFETMSEDCRKREHVSL